MIILLSLIMGLRYTITVPTLLVSKFNAGFIQQGSTVSFVASGTTIRTPVGLKLKGLIIMRILKKYNWSISFIR
jgi:hypothetical protein